MLRSTAARSKLVRIFCSSLTFCALTVLLGCVPSRQWQILPTTALSPALLPPAAPVHYPPPQPSVAVVEYDDQGKLLSQCSTPSATDCQEGAAVRFITDSRKIAEAAHKQLVVLTFIHGWRHNASWSSLNFKNFQEIIACLNWGEPAYKLAYPESFNKKGEPRKGHASCHAVTRQSDTIYAGVYLSWRGLSIRPDSDYLGLFLTSANSRRRAAEKVAAGDIQNTLQRLSVAAKDDGGSPLQPKVPSRFILVGHSYGGLIASRVSQSILQKSFKNPPTPCSSDKTVDAGVGHPGFADLVILLNPATNSVRAAGFMQQMKQTPTAFCPGLGKVAGSIQRPLIVSMHTASDTTTGRLQYLDFKFFGVDSDLKGRPYIAKEVGRSEREGAPFKELIQNPLNHLDYIHSGCYVDQINNGDWICDRLVKKLVEIKKLAFKNTNLTPATTTEREFERGAYELIMSVCGGDEEFNYVHPLPCDPGLRMKRDKLQNELVRLLEAYFALPYLAKRAEPSIMMNLYQRLDVGCSTLLQSPLRCGKERQQPSATYLDRQTWNDTPFWEFNISYELLQKHGGFWNGDVFDIITQMAGEFPVTPKM